MNWDGLGLIDHFVCMLCMYVCIYLCVCMYTNHQHRRRRRVDPEKVKRKREKARLAYIEKLKAEGACLAYRIQFFVSCSCVFEPSPVYPLVLTPSPVNECRPPPAGRYDPSRKPDPERWIPKSQRSYNKRGTCVAYVRVGYIGRAQISCPNSLMHTPSLQTMK